jgi:hypothetical protein
MPVSQCAGWRRAGQRFRHLQSLCDVLQARARQVGVPAMGGVLGADFESLPSDAASFAVGSRHLRPKIKYESAVARRIVGCCSAGIPPAPYNKRAIGPSPRSYEGPASAGRRNCSRKHIKPLALAAGLLEHRLAHYTNSASGKEAGLKLEDVKNASPARGCRDQPRTSTAIAAWTPSDAFNSGWWSSSTRRRTLFDPNSFFFDSRQAQGKNGSSVRTRINNERYFQEHAATMTPRAMGVHVRLTCRPQMERVDFRLICAELGITTGGRLGWPRDFEQLRATAPALSANLCSVLDRPERRRIQ